MQRAGKIQIESTSFTVSEPTEKYYIEPLIYKLSNDDEKKILEEQFDITKIEIEIIKLERMFIDKIFAAEFYYIRNMYMDTAKHLYDISVLFNNNKIQKLLSNKYEYKSTQLALIFKKLVLSLHYAKIAPKVKIPKLSA